MAAAAALAGQAAGKALASLAAGATSPPSSDEAKAKAHGQVARRL
jgi:hypothetical protein